MTQLLGLELCRLRLDFLFLKVNRFEQNVVRFLNETPTPLKSLS